MAHIGNICSDARHEQIKYELRLLGLSLSSIATELRITRSAVSSVRRHSYPRVEKAIAHKLGRPPQQIWPDRYDSKGNPLRRKRGRRANTDIVGQFNQSDGRQRNG